MNDVNLQGFDESALRSMEHKVDELPMLPQVLVRILQLSPDSKDYFEHFSSLAKEDPPFAVRVVALANSARSAPINPIVSIEGALTRLGTSAVTNLVASLAVQRVFVPSQPNQVRLWRHSITAAVAASRIAKSFERLKLDAGQAYLAGLLHDIGRFVMFEHAPEELLAVDEHNWQSPEQLIDADLEVYKYTHSQIGYLACRQWGLPERIANIVRDHHVPPEHALPGSQEALTFCILLADRLCVYLLESKAYLDLDAREKEAGVESHCLVSEIDKTLMKPADLLPHLDDMHEESQALIESLGFAEKG